ncbi:E3 ubiquitin-protein ligase [Zea mays]|uniref:RING-type E3 ubiquitin transferase n=3 Tax=Zea mays TaxID=4577 RepID=A0A1D6HZ89_MAIZE|nr:E3 ubiquitin-protein ligase [Zea mays]
MLWNLAFVAVAAAVLAASVGERPTVPLRVWIVGYVLQCLLHVLSVTVEYRRRRRNADQEGAGDEDLKLSIVKHLESANTMFSFIWWIVGFYWVSAGGKALSHDAPQLYWLSIVFLAFDVFFVVFCVALACVIGIAVCCCLPCIIAILYAVTDQQEGASEDDINNLSKFKFQTMSDADKLAAGIAAPVGGVMTECGTNPPVEHILSAEDAECCICLCPYEDGVELRELPCNHHFHCSCIDKWLHINATCPLCKFDIIKSNRDIEEV